VEIVSMVAGVAAAALGLVLVRRLVSLEVLREQHDVAAAAFAVIGGFYGVVLAFVLVASWERFEHARANTEVEANALRDLERQAGGLPALGGTALRAEIDAYARSVVDDDWPAMREERVSDRTQQLADEIWHGVVDMQPQEGRDVALYQCMVQKLDDFAEARRDRLLYIHNALPPLIWNFLVVFGIVTVGFTYFFGIPRLMPQMIITVALAATIACTLFIIWEMQTPFSGAVTVPDRAFRVIFERPAS